MVYQSWEEKVTKPCTCTYEWGVNYPKVKDTSEVRSVSPQVSTGCAGTFSPTALAPVPYNDHASDTGLKPGEKPQDQLAQARMP